MMQHEVSVMRNKIRLDYYYSSDPYIQVCVRVSQYTYIHIWVAEVGYWKLMEDQRIMFILGLVHTRDNGLTSIWYWAETDR